MTERKVAGRYRLLEPIGEGGMGVVWRSHDELLDRVVAVKEVRYRGVDEAARADLNRRTIREAKTAGRLDHPSVIIVHDVVEEEGRPWIVMQLVRSRSLGEVVRERGPLSPERVASVGLHVLGALRAAHAAGVLHRDVKPENVLLADDGRVVLTDFGIASMTQETGITRTGGMVGTPAFLPPERLHGLPATPESDLWSLGATLYAALEGHPPFERPTAAATMMAVLNGEPSPMSHTGPLASAILGLMAREPAARMTADVAEALLTRAAADQRPGGTEPEGRPAQAGPLPRHTPAPPVGDLTRYGGGVPYPADPGWRGESSHTSPSQGAPSPYAGQPSYSGQPSPGGPYAAEPYVRDPYAAEPRYAAEPSRPAGAPQDAWHPQHDRRAGQPPLPQDQAAFQLPQDQAAFQRRTGPTQVGQPFPYDGRSAPAPHAGQPAPTNDPFGSLHRGAPTQASPQPYPDDPFRFSYPTPPTQAEQPSYQGPRTRRGQHAATGESYPLGRRTTTGRTALMVGIPALVLAVGVGGWLVLQNRGEGQGTDPTGRPTATAATTGATATPVRPSKSPRPTGGPARLPEGWEPYRDPLGFTVGMPRGWVTKRFSGRDRVEFRAPGSSAFLWIESTEDIEKDPVRHWEKVERDGLALKNWPGYERVGITPLRYRGVEAADWEFTYLKKNVLTHVLDRGFHTATGRPYAIYWESPDSEWDRTFFDRFTETFRP